MDRKALHDLSKELDALVELFCAVGPVLRGTISTFKRRCGHPGCRCAQGNLHETLVLLERTPAGRRVRKLSPKEARRLRDLCRHYRQLLRARARVGKLSAELLESLDRLWLARLRSGDRFLGAKKG